MATTTFLFLRHGAHVAGHGVIAGRSAEAVLSPLGHEQAARLADRVALAPVAALYSSPVRRTMETAAAVAARLGLAVRPCEALAEVDFGDWAGRHVDDLRAGDPRWRWWNEFRSGTRAPGGETAVEVQARVVGETLRLREAHPGAVVALVSHADVIRAALAWALGIPLDLVRRLEVGLASASVVAVGDGGPWVLGVNLVDGLPLPQ